VVGRFAGGNRLDEKLPLVPPKSALGNALNYTDKQWDRLTVYTKSGRLRIDIHLTENAIRPFVVGRKNWLFCDTVSGARASANLYSLIESARSNSIEPYAYYLSPKLCTCTGVTIIPINVF